MTTQETVSAFAEDMMALKQREQRNFKLKVAFSWLIMLLILGFLFSGLEINLGLFTLKSLGLDYDFIRRWAPKIYSGVKVTLQISVVSIALAVVLALLSALGRLSRNPPIYALSVFYISLIRGTPLYLQIFFFFLALPQFGIILSGYTAGVLALGVNYGAYMSEIFRAGIESINVGQIDAATALGMTAGQRLRLIVLPQAMRFVIPPSGNEFIAMLKDSSLVSTTGFVREILWNAQRGGRLEARMMEALLVAAVFYWIMTLVLSIGQSRLEARMGKGYASE